jgi:hypothetical protein
VSSTAGEQVLPGLRRPLGHDPDRIYQPPAIE